MNLIFRKLNPDNAQDIAQFNVLLDDLTSGAKDKSKQTDLIRRVNAREDAYIMVAEDQETGILCGTAMAITFEDPCDECQAVMVIENVVTHHDYRGRGIGRKMFDELEAWARAHNVYYAILCSSMHRTGAHKFYDALGYQEVKGYKKFL